MILSILLIVLLLILVCAFLLVVFIIPDVLYDVDFMGFFRKHFSYEAKLKKNDCGCYNCKWRVKELSHYYDNRSYYCHCPTPSKKNNITGEIESHPCINCFADQDKCKWEAIETENES